MMRSTRRKDDVELVSHNDQHTLRTVHAPLWPIPPAGHRHSPDPNATCLQQCTLFKRGSDPNVAHNDQHYENICSIIFVKFQFRSGVCTYKEHTYVCIAYAHGSYLYADSNVRDFVKR
ncbi:unnamed protein product [Ectocarpus sp. 12 AP-2014]